MKHPWLAAVLGGLLSVGLCWPAAGDRRPTLADFYRTQFGTMETHTVRTGVEGVLPDWPRTRQQAAVDEIMTFDRVIYHETSRHHFLQNLDMARRYEPEIRATCSRYSIPAAPVEAIITWENSGGPVSLSPSGCVGLGQLSMGAVECSHGMVAGLASRHGQLAHRAHAADERYVPECNIEDTALFFKSLYDHYAARADLAISAYHNGRGNTDDLVRVWLARHRPDLAGLSIPTAVRASGVTYLDMWNDRYVREIMAGLRTMEGAPANDGNRYDLLGDESDIYPWKVIGAYGALRSPQQDDERLVERYRPPADVAETEALHHFLTAASMARGDLVRYQGRLMRPEVAGFLRQFAGEIAARVKKPHWKLGAAVYEDPVPMVPAAGVPLMTADAASHQTGASVDVIVGDDATGRAVDDTLEYLFTMDRIYLRSHALAGSKGHCYHVTLNPRYGQVFGAALR